MARTATLDTLRALARRLANVENDTTNVTDAELLTLANLHYPTLYDELVAAAPPEYYSATTAVVTAAGTTTYALPATFKDLTDVHVRETSDARRPLYPMPSGSRSRFKAPTGVWTIDVDYTPAATVLTTGSDTIDGVSGYEEVVAALMARDVMVKREADPGAVMAIIERGRARIRSMARNRDRGQPKRIVDLDDAMPSWPWEYAFGSGIACYRLRGNNIEFYEPLSGYP